jgi:hypothetical protein
MGIEENPNNLSTPDVIGLVRQAARDPKFMQDYLQKQVYLDPPVMDPTPPVMDSPVMDPTPPVMDPMTDNTMFDRSPVTVQDPMPLVNPPVFQQELQPVAPPVFQPQVPVRNIPFQSTGGSQRDAPFRFGFQPERMPISASEQILDPSRLDFQPERMPVRESPTYTFAPQIMELARRTSRPNPREYRGIMQTLNQKQV